MSTMKRLAASTMLGLAMVGATVQQAFADIYCFGAQFEGIFIDRSGGVWEVYSCDFIVIT